MSLTFKNHTTKYILIGLALLAALGILYFYRQNSTQAPQIPYTSPFTHLNYLTAILDSKEIQISSGKKLAQRANIYNAAPLLPPLLTEEDGINQLKEALEIQETDQQMAPTEEIFWYNNNRYLSFNQKDNSLTFTLNIRSQANLPQEGQCLSSDDAKQYAISFFSTHKLLTGQNGTGEEYQVSYEELTPVGLLPVTDIANCQIVKATYYPQLDGHTIINSQGERYIRVMKIGGENQTAGFFVYNTQFAENRANAPLKNLAEIKLALQENKAVYLNTCSNEQSSATINLAAPELVYFVNHKLKTAHPVFKLTRQVTDLCEEIVLVRGLEEGWYE
ncbi:hypothetical protein KKB83_03060 [Patescibacteria group bacterium]|nr:hypothetical protein [Patescibacteria group bacterium]